MKKNPNIKYYILLTIGFLLVVSVQYYAPKPINWTESYSKQDKIPYGSYILRDLLGDVFSEKNITESKLPAYNELKEQENTNYIIINSEFSPDDLDIEKLLEFAEDGNQLFVSASSFGNKFSDTLNIQTEGYNLSFEEDSLGNLDVEKSDSVNINFTNPQLKTKKGYTFNKRFTNYYFTSVDTAATTVLGKDDKNRINFIRIEYGKGFIYLNTLPKTFTNYFLVDTVNYEYAFKALSYLPNQNVIWDEYYKSGRRVVSTPLRFVLSSPALKASCLLLILGLLIYIIFNVKRKQRIIPVITPLGNSTVEFVDVVGTLYYQNKDHHNLATKKVTYFLELVRATYLLETNKLDEEFVYLLASKSGVEEKKVSELISFIKKVKNSTTEQELLKLNTLITQFHKNKLR